MSSEQQKPEPGMTRVTLNKNPPSQTRPIGQVQQQQVERGEADQKQAGSGGDEESTGSHEGQTKREQMSHVEGQQGGVDDKDK